MFNEREILLLTSALQEKANRIRMDRSKYVDRDKQASQVAELNELTDKIRRIPSE